VNSFLVPGTDLEDSRIALELARSNHSIYAAAGIHPGESGGISIDDMEQIVQLLLEPSVVAVGETGMDLYHSTKGVEEQRVLFQQHLRMARAFGLSLIVHSRMAENEVLEVLDGEEEIPVILHCYTGPSELAISAAERGYYIGFAGPLTYPGNGELRRLAAELPPDRILTETDAPFLSPQPVRGRRNEPAYLAYTVEVMAETLGMSLHDTVSLLWNNSIRALGLEQGIRTDLVYRMYGNIYMNITGMCTNHCRFCIRDRTDGLGGYHLRHDMEPDEERLREIVNLLPASRGDELVFCGYGEPTMRPALLRELARSASARGYATRLNTNGTCLLWMDEDRAREMLESFNSVSISLNASSEEEYNRICRPESSSAWRALLSFIDFAGENRNLRLTAVRYPGVDVKAVKEMAASMDVELRVR
jgi:TatD DNase family protein